MTQIPRNALIGFRLLWQDIKRIEPLQYIAQISGVAFRWMLLPGLALGLLSNHGVSFDMNTALAILTAIGSTKIALSLLHPPMKPEGGIEL